MGRGRAQGGTPLLKPANQDQVRSRLGEYPRPARGVLISGSLKFDFELAGIDLQVNFLRGYFTVVHV